LGKKSFKGGLVRTLGGGHSSSEGRKKEKKGNTLIRASAELNEFELVRGLQNGKRYLLHVKWKEEADAVTEQFYKGSHPEEIHLLVSRGMNIEPKRVDERDGEIGGGEE